MSKDTKSDVKNEEKTKFLFQDGETVLCYHGPLLYEAKCLKAELKNKTSQYLIHYSGWNKSWDEWVTSPRVCKFSEDNLKKQQELLKSHGTSKIITKIKANARKSISNINSSLGPNDPDKLNGLEGRKKRSKAQEESSDLSDSYSVKCDIKVIIPDELKKILANEHHNISALNKVVNLPATKNINTILEEYIKYKLEQKIDNDVIIEVVDGVKNYFNSAIATKLLINNCERVQNLELIKNSNKKPSEVYGAEHLLRLFVIVGDLLSYTFWDEICIKQIELYLEDIVKFLDLKSSSLFNANNYIVAQGSLLQKPTEKK